jgi:glycosyltransferase involved in cell wall biosynthesis
MRIGVNSLFLVPGDVGGTEVYLRKNLEEMAVQFPEHTFVLFTARDNDAVLRADLQHFRNVEFHLIGIRAVYRPVRIIAEQLALPLQAMRAALDVMWSPGYTAPLFCPCPQVVTIHDLQYLSYPEDMKWLERRTLDFLVRGACRSCCHIITVSRFSKEELVRHGFAGEEKISVVYEGVDQKFGEVSDFPPESKRVVPVDAPYILCVAHTYPHKKVDLLVEAFSLIEDRIPHKLVLIGKARRGEEKLENALAQIDDPGRVLRFSGLQFKELIKAFQQADLFVLPSIYEGFGLPVLEAMMAGVHVITSSSASLPEVGGECATYVDTISGAGFAGAILNYLDLPKEQRDTMRNNAMSWAKRFSWRVSAAGITGKLVAECKTRGQ